MAERLMKLEIISPDKTFHSGDVAMVEYNTTEGEVGVYPGHIPMTQIVAPGELIITEENEKKNAALMSGFIEIKPDKMTILAEVAEWPDEIDIHRAEEAKIRAERRIKNANGENMDIQRAELALKRALLRLGMAKK